MVHAGRLVVGAGLLVGGVLIALYGLFASLYGGDSGSGNTYVKLGGREIDAGLVGAIALVVAVILLLCSVLLLKRGRSSVKPS